jgi:hypothetical protein
MTSIFAIKVTVGIWIIGYEVANHIRFLREERRSKNDRLRRCPDPSAETLHNMMSHSGAGE